MTVCERHFRSAPQQVYDAIVDAERYPRWLVGAKVVRVVDASWPNPGAEFRHTVGAGPLEVDDRTTVRDVQPGRGLDLIVRARPFIEAEVRFRIAPDGTGSVLSMNERPLGIFRLATPLLAPFVKARNARSLERLAALID
ncbi:MAG: hypothetical protein JWN99_2711 [Ilumatobacteraceae bacterium]|nr:hypothetical protein [Ilumatobacteraceae bacterium]